MSSVLKKLTGGDRRTIGRANEVVDEVLDDPLLFADVFAGMLVNDPIVRMRAADVVEKVSAKHPELLQPHKRRLIGEVTLIDQQEIRWHVAQMIPRQKLRSSERAAAVKILLGYLHDKSHIVKTFSMQALADLAVEDTHLRRRVLPLLKELTKTGSPSMRARGKKLLHRLESQKISSDQ